MVQLSSTSHGGSEEYLGLAFLFSRHRFSLLRMVAPLVVGTTEVVWFGCAQVGVGVCLVGGGTLVGREVRRLRCFCNCMDLRVHRACV